MLKAMASVSCASREMAPCEIAPVEKLRDLGDRLDLFERIGSPAGRARAGRAAGGRVFVHETGERVVAFLALRTKRLLEDVRARSRSPGGGWCGPDRVVERVHDIGIVHVELAAVLELDEARGAEPGRDLLYASACRRRTSVPRSASRCPRSWRRAVEAQRDDLAAEPVRLEDLADRYSRRSRCPSST